MKRKHRIRTFVLVWVWFALVLTWLFFIGRDNSLAGKAFLWSAVAFIATLFEAIMWLVAEPDAKPVKRAVAPINSNPQPIQRPILPPEENKETKPEPKKEEDEKQEKSKEALSAWVKANVDDIVDAKTTGINAKLEISKDIEEAARDYFLNRDDVEDIQFLEENNVEYIIVGFCKNQN